MDRQDNPGSAMGESGQDKPVIGIVGGVSAGKSTAAREFAALGCALIDADAIGYQLLEEDNVREELRKRWGEKIFKADGSVDREVLGEIVFADSSGLAVLNEIMQERIGSRIAQRIDEARRDAKVSGIVLDAAILFEAGWDSMCSHVVFVSASEEQRSARATRRGWDNERWAQREKSQISLDKKEARCYCSVDNSSSVSHLREQVRRIFQHIMHKAE